MNYIAKQRLAKLDDSYVAYKLGIKRKEYREYKLGKKAFANEKLNTFMELTDTKKQYFLEQRTMYQAANKWFEEQSVESLKKEIMEFNTTVNELSADIGVDQAQVCNVVNKKENSKNCDGVRFLIYNYLKDDNNRRLIKDNKRKKYKINIIKNENPEKEEELPQKEENDAIKLTDDAINTKKEEVWYKEYQTMATKYNETKEELDRYKFLIDEIRMKQKAIDDLMFVLHDKGENDNE